MREYMPSKHCEQNLWLLKPANMNQGRGIEIIRNIRELRASMSAKPAHSQWVLQKYIEKPMLYHERKFDIRVWALVNDSCDVFLYKDGYIRTSSEKYSLDSGLNYVHLTNNCLQVHGENYSKHEPGNTLSYAIFKEYMSKAYENVNPKVDFDTQIMPRIKDLIIDTILSVKTGVISAAKKRGCNFELLGYDFMIDEDLRVWLIEVNTNPYIGIPNTYIKGILPLMLDSMFNITLDSIYPSNQVKEKPENRFELIYCEKHSKFASGAINQRRSFSKSLIYPVKDFEWIPGKRQPSPKHKARKKQDPSNLNISGSSPFKKVDNIKTKQSLSPIKGLSTDPLQPEQSKTVDILSLNAITPDGARKLFEQTQIISKPRATPNVRKRIAQKLHKTLGLEEFSLEIVKNQNYLGVIQLFDKILNFIRNNAKNSAIPQNEIADFGKVFFIIFSN